MLRATVSQVLAFRRGVLGLRSRAPSTGRAGVVAHGLQDSAPRSAVLALHARLDGVGPDDWCADGLTQVWGPRGAVHVVADATVFARGLLPRDEAAATACAGAADRLADVLAGGERRKRDAVDAGLDQADLLAASATGRVRLRWDGRDTIVRSVAPPGGDAEDDRRVLARRFLHACGPATAAGLAHWAGIARPDAEETWAALAGDLVEVDVSGTTRALLAADADALAAADAGDDGGAVRLLPPGDPYLAVNDRALLVPDADRRRAVWPSSPYPGVVLADGHLAGTWRRRGAHVTVTPWGAALRRTHADAVESEVASLPLAAGHPRLSWAD